MSGCGYFTTTGAFIAALEKPDDLEEKIERVRKAQAWAADLAAKWTVRAQALDVELARLEASRDLKGQLTKPRLTGSGKPDLISPQDPKTVNPLAREAEAEALRFGLDPKKWVRARELTEALGSGGRVEDCICQAKDPKLCERCPENPRRYKNLSAPDSNEEGDP